MSSTRTTDRLRAGWLSAVAGGLIAAFLAVLAAAAYPPFHESLHHDAHESGHECGITLLLNGSMDGAPEPAALPEDSARESIKDVGCRPVWVRSIFLSS
ncbi:MAG: hypothetical protein M3463_21980, partial [Verrucomicrobiota bacterium]|nr:hypothetical protein [Verrucomicrobiota bacterium]